MFFVVSVWTKAQSDLISMTELSLLDSNTLVLNQGQFNSAPFAMRRIKTSVNGDTMNIDYKGSILFVSRYYRKEKNRLDFNSRIRYFNCRGEKWFINENGLLERYE